METTRQLKVTKALSVAELLKLGRCLTEGQLADLGILEKVKEAERDVTWRLNGAMDLLRELPGETRGLLERLKDDFLARLEGKRDGTARVTGGAALPRGRKRPGPGTLLEKRHGYQQYNVQDPRKGKGKRFHVFRFLVVDEAGHILWLEDPKDRIFRNPSAAARAATGNDAEDGWRFFGWE